MIPKGVTLRGLEVFGALAQSGSVAHAAEVTGLSQPAVSQQLRNLEAALGIELFDHSKRPKRLTPAGQTFLARSEAALSELRMAQSELVVMDLAHLSSLSIGLIDDFDNDLTPRLATVLTDSLQHSTFRLMTAYSHTILNDVAERKLHIAISASDGAVRDGIDEYPLVNDPFILVAPKGAFGTDPATRLNDLPFLRYDNAQLIARTIEAHLGRERLEFQNRYEIGSHLALMAMVARGTGWALTTPLGFMRATRFHNQIDAYPVPFSSFARTISLFAPNDWAGDVALDIAATMRRLVQAHMIEPALDKLPWLEGDLRVHQP